MLTTRRRIFCERGRGNEKSNYDESGKVYTNQTRKTENRCIVQKIENSPRRVITFCKLAVVFFFLVRNYGAHVITSHGLNGRHDRAWTLLQTRGDKKGDTSAFPRMSNVNTSNNKN